jgi:mannose-6-phosphate isomerase-like protein (cupin superfamily)
MTADREIDHRPWGWFEVLLDEPSYKVKRITVNPGQRLSLQFHRRRAEHWFVVAGRGVVTCGDREIPVEAGAAVDIPREAPHRIHNTGAEPLTFIETQRGDYFGEDDIVRLADDYRRT